MEQEEKLEPNTPLPVLPRLDRLDRLLQLLEEKHGLSGRHSSASSVVGKVEYEDQCKTISSALEEVHRKGTLMGRLSMLENRVLQLSLEMDEGDTSRSSSSTVQVSEKFGHEPHGSCLPLVTKQNENENEDDDLIVSVQGRQDPLLLQEEGSVEACVTKQDGCNNGGRQGRKAYRKWFGWFRMGC